MRRWLVALLAVSFVLVACGDDGDDGDDGDSAPTSVAGDGTVVGFDTAHVLIRRADGTVCELCTYTARDRQQWSQGLMGVTDLEGHDGMIFVSDEPAAHAFWMKDTLMPLSAAFFAADGSLAGTFDMVPCAPGTERCPTYGPPGEVTHVLEVPQGDLDTLGIATGSMLQSVGPPCVPE